MGCIFTENLIVPDASVDEINAAVEEAGAGVAAGEDVTQISDLAASFAGGDISAVAGKSPCPSPYSFIPHANTAQAKPPPSSPARTTPEETSNPSPAP